MWKKKKVISFLLAVSLCMGIIGCGGKKEAGTSGKPLAPDFSAELNNGDTFKLSEHKGEVILLNFWATWCPPCVGEMPAFEKLYKEYGDKVQIIAVNSQEEQAVVDEFIKEKGYTFPIAYDMSGKVGKTYQIVNLPYTLVIGKDGRIEKTFTGARDADTQYKLYRSAIKEAVEKE